MDHDIARKKKHRKSLSPQGSTQSKFFQAPPEPRACSVQRRHSDGVIAVAGPSKPEGKENLYIVVDDDDEAAETSEPDLDGSDLSLKVQYDHDTDLDLHVDEFPDVVEQEDGYISPIPSCSNDVQDLSSPLRPGQPPACRKWGSDQHQRVENSALAQSDEDSYFGVEAISSPVSPVKRCLSPFVGKGFIHETPVKRNANNADGCILVHATPSPTKVQYAADEIPSPILYYGPDLRNALALATDGATDLDYEEHQQELQRKKSCPELRYNSTSPPSPSPDTSDSQVKVVINVDSDYDWEEENAEQARANAFRTKAIMNGWRDRWALTSKIKKATGEGKTKSTPRGAAPRTVPGSGTLRIANLRRSNTNVTPQGRHTLSSTSREPRSAPSKLAASGGSELKPISAKGLGKARRSILFVNEMTNPSAHNRDGGCRDDSSNTNDGIGMVSGRLDDIALRADERLSMFR